jgi:hypothetical protein
VYGFFTARIQRNLCQRFKENAASFAISRRCKELWLSVKLEKLAELHINYEEVPLMMVWKYQETVQDFQGREDEIPQEKTERNDHIQHR